MKKLLSILLFVLTLPIFGQVASWEFVESYSASSEDLNTNPIEWKIQGDLYDYKVYMILSPITPSVYFRLNDDSGTNYRRYSMSGASTTASASTADTETLMGFIAGNGSTPADYRHLFMAELTGSSGNERVFDFSLARYAVSNGDVTKATDYWKNTADEATKLSIIGNTTTGVSLDAYLFQRPKTGVYNAEDWEIVDKWDSSIPPDVETKLLLHMDDTGLTDSSRTGHTVTKNGDVTRSATQSKFGGYSAYFDGTGDYLSISSSADLVFGNDNFTIDGWVYLSDATAPQFLYAKRDPLEFEGLNIYANGGNLTVLVSYTGTTWDINATFGTIPLNQWVHWAVVRNGSTLIGFMNGVSTTITNTFSTIYDNGNDVQIGGQNGDFYLTGYLDEVRISKGIARWTSNFTPPTEPYQGGSRNLNTDPIDFLVQGTNKEYRLEVDSDNSLITRFNGDSGANYSVQSLNNNGGSIASSGSTTATSAGLFYNSTLNIICQESQYKSFFLDTAKTSSTNQSYSAFWWRNTADDLTKITVSDTVSQTSSGVMTLYERTGFQSSINAHEKLVEEYVFDSVNLSGGYSFKNVPQEDVILKLVITGKADTTNETLTTIINGDSGSNYDFQYLLGTGSTASAGSGTTTSIGALDFNTTYTGISIWYIFPKTDKYRPMLREEMGLTGAIRIIPQAFWWKNTADNIQDFTFTATSTNAITGKIQLYKIPLK